MTVFLQSLRSHIAKAITKGLLRFLMVMRTHGPISLLRNLRPMQRPTMPFFKHSVTMTF